MTTPHRTKKTPHSEELLSSFFSFVCGGRTREDTTGTPSKEGETAIRGRGGPNHSNRPATATATTTTTVYHQYGRLDRSNLSVWWSRFVEVVV